MSSRDVVEVLVAGRELRLLSVVADAVGGLIATGNDAVVELVEQRLSFHHCSVVIRHGHSDVLEHGRVVFGVQRIRFAWVLEEIVEDGGLVDGHAVAVAFVAVKVVVDGESAVTFLSVLWLAHDALGAVVRLVLAEPDRHQVVLAVVEERLVGRFATVENDVLDALAIVLAVCRQTGPREIGGGGDDVHGGDDFVGDSWFDLIWPVDDVRNAMTSFPREGLSSSEDIGVATFFAVLTMRTVVGDEEDHGVIIDVQVFQFRNDFFNGCVHLQEIVAIATATRGACEIFVGEETGVHVGVGDEEEEGVVLVVFDEADGVASEELGETAMLVRLGDEGVVLEQVAGLSVGEFQMEPGVITCPAVGEGQEMTHEIESVVEWEMSAVGIRLLVDSKMPFSDHAGFVVGLLHRLGNRHLALGQARGRPRQEHPGLSVCPDTNWQSTCHDSGPAGGTDRVADVPVSEPHSLSSHVVDESRLLDRVSVRCQITDAHVVCDQEDDIWPVVHTTIAT